jgi:hypothetical protein
LEGWFSKNAFLRVAEAISLIIMQDRKLMTEASI